MKSILLLLAAGILHTPAAWGTTHQVLIEGMKFQPDTVTLHAGDTVVWSNKDFFPHTVTGQGFDSKEIAAQAKWKHVFKKKGVLDYACTLHPTMKGKLTVQ